jgi:release factor glutamine methyltransferase
MTYLDIYNDLSTFLGKLYDDREGATIARYLIEDLYDKSFWNEELASDSHVQILKDVKNRLRRYEPWQYIGGIADFYGMRFCVDKHVLIPRPETEELVAIALENIAENNYTTALDVGTGSGIIPITILKKSRSLSKVQALDISEKALNVARLNEKKHGLNKIEWFQLDFLDISNWPQLSIPDILISNPPYIDISEAKELHPNVLNHEPHLALFTKDNVLEHYIAIGRFASSAMKSGSCVTVEIHEAHGQDVVGVFKENGLHNIELIKDMQGKDRVVVAYVL